jgi:hypothetical protein
VAAEDLIVVAPAMEHRCYRVTQELVLAVICAPAMAK